MGDDFGFPRFFGDLSGGNATIEHIHCSYCMLEHNYQNVLPVRQGNRLLIKAVN